MKNFMRSLHRAGIQTPKPAESPKILGNKHSVTNAQTPTTTKAKIICLDSPAK